MIRLFFLPRVILGYAVAILAGVVIVLIALLVLCFKALLGALEYLGGRRKGNPP